MPALALRANGPERSRIMLLPVAVAKLKDLASTRLGRREDGQDLLEYALLCGLIALVAFGAVTTVGNVINQVFWQSIATNF
jgi:Flp pilus assembly pilin Flp